MALLFVLSTLLPSCSESLGQSGSVSFPGDTWGRGRGRGRRGEDLFKRTQRKNKNQILVNGTAITCCDLRTRILHWPWKTGSLNPSGRKKRLSEAPTAGRAGSRDGGAARAGRGVHWLVAGARGLMGRHWPGPAFCL